MCRLSSARHHNKKGKEIVPKISGPRKLERPQPEAEAVYRGYHAVPLSRARHGIATQHCTSSFLKKIATNKSGPDNTQRVRTAPDGLWGRSEEIGRQVLILLSFQRNVPNLKARRHRGEKCLGKIIDSKCSLLTEFSKMHHVKSPPRSILRVTGEGHPSP